MRNGLNMKLHPYIWLGFGSRIWTTYFVQEGQAIIRHSVSGKEESIMLKDASIRTITSWWRSFGDITITDAGGTTQTWYKIRNVSQIASYLRDLSTIPPVPVAQRSHKRRIPFYYWLFHRTDRYPYSLFTIEQPIVFPQSAQASFNDLKRKFEESCSSIEPTKSIVLGMTEHEAHIFLKRNDYGWYIKWTSGNRQNVDSGVDYQSYVRSVEKPDSEEEFKNAIHGIRQLLLDVTRECEKSQYYRA